MSKARTILENEQLRELEMETPATETSRERGSVRSIQDLLEEQVIKKEDEEDSDSSGSSESPPSSPQYGGRIPRQHLRARRGPAPDQILDMFASMVRGSRFIQTNSDV